MTLNRYTYCYNDPVKYVDMDGNRPSPAKTLVQENISAKKEHYNRNDISYDKPSQNEWIEERIKSGGEKQLIADAQNQKMDSQKEGWRKAPDNQNVYHVNENSTQGTAARFNKKYLYHNSDGSSYEVIIGVNSRGEYYIVKDPTNAGTYNKSDALDPLGAVGHAIVDIMPYWNYKNNEKDRASQIERIRGSEKSCIK